MRCFSFLRSVLRRGAEVFRLLSGFLNMTVAPRLDGSYVSISMEVTNNPSHFGVVAEQEEPRYILKNFAFSAVLMFTNHC